MALTARRLASCSGGGGYAIDTAAPERRSDPSWSEHMHAQWGAFDSMQLYWSARAALHAWVEAEWRSALETQPADFLEVLRLDDWTALPDALLRAHLAPPDNPAGKTAADFGSASPAYISSDPDTAEPRACDIALGQLLGQGQFGEVHAARWTRPAAPGLTTPGDALLGDAARERAAVDVVVKVLRHLSSDELMTAAMMEANFMAMTRGCPNVVRSFGSCVGTNASHPAPPTSPLISPRGRPEGSGSGIIWMVRLWGRWALKVFLLLRLPCVCRYRYFMYYIFLYLYHYVSCIAPRPHR